MFTEYIRLKDFPSNGKVVKYSSPERILRDGSSAVSESFQTSMHSSRMRTTPMLTVSRSIGLG